MIIRPAHFGDEQRLARVYVDTWMATYRGLLNQSFLSSLNQRDVTVQWVRTLEHAETVVYLAQDERQEIVGFITGGKESSGSLAFDAEIYTLYILPDYQHRGIGNRLLRAAADALRSAGYGSLVIWVLKGNPAVEFYRKMGGMQVAEKTTPLGDTHYPEVAFGWLDIQTAGRDPFPISQNTGENLKE
ncbi:MAG TPA: GNAT family N-acetyltransferase [Spirochaetia bacterium]|nr:GNAT family N-acetyltransferase [Spirochaetia bacterium]